jgi:ketosteroid isomerase-like protein
MRTSCRWRYGDHLVCMATANNETPAAEIRALIDERLKAVQNKNAEGLVAHTASDVLTFDIVKPLQNVGAAAVKKRAQEWFASYDGPMGYEIRDLEITAGADVAFCHFLNHVTGTSNDGKQIDMWWRATAVFCKVEGQWMLTHEHDSVPFDMESGLASLDLQPQG